MGRLAQVGCWLQKAQPFRKTSFWYFTPWLSWSCGNVNGESPKFQTMHFKLFRQPKPKSPIVNPSLNLNCGVHPLYESAGNPSRMFHGAWKKQQKKPNFTWPAEHHVGNTPHTLWKSWGKKTAGQRVATQQLNCQTWQQIAQIGDHTIVQNKGAAWLNSAATCRKPLTKAFDRGAQQVYQNPVHVFNANCPTMVPRERLSKSLNRVSEKPSGCHQKFPNLESET